VAQVHVRCAFLELESPDLATAVAQLASEGAHVIRVVPMFLGAGRHAREDLPLLVEACRRAHPTVQFELAPAVGENPRVLDLIASIALD
jgi:sirohydrochlorin cobaltochelatase